MGNRTSRAFTWKIENFSTIQNKKLYSNNFYVGGNKWQLFVFPKGFKVDDHLSVYLSVPDSKSLPHGWSRYAQFRFTAVNQLGCETSITKATKHEFNASANSWGYASFLPLNKLKDPKKGYLVNDACLLKFDISTDENNPLEESDKLIPVELKSMDQVNSPIPMQESNAPKLPTVHTSSHSEAIEADRDPSEEHIKTFFKSLESDLASVNINPSEEAYVNIIPSREAAKEALATIEEALNMAPSDFHDSKKFPSIKNALKVLSAFDRFSSALTYTQKAKLLDMEKGFKQLPERVVKALQDKNRHTEKLALSLDLEHSLTKFKEAETKKQKLVAEQKEIFKVSAKLIEQLEALEQEGAEYEAKAKVAEEEEKTVVAEWGKMRDFVASIKKKF